MSMRSWSEQGYGYPLFNGKNFRRVVDFIIENDEKNYTDEEAREMRDCEDEFDLEEYIDDPVSWKVAEIINRLENTSVFQGYQPCGDTDVESHIGVGLIYPWSDERMSKEKANGILMKYAGVFGIEEAPDYFDLEYFG